MRAVFAGVSYCLIVAAFGCREDSTGPTVVEPPSFVRATVPADSAENVFGSTDISVTFRRSVFEAGVRLDLFPAPISHGPQLLSPTGRNLTWLGVELDADELAYRLLVDGASVPSPEMIEFFPGTRPGISGRMGGCLSLARSGPDLSEAVVFALRPDDFDLSLVSLPDFFLRQHATSATLVSASPGRCGSFYFFTYLRVQELVVIAVLDTSGDGVYDLHRDWWGTRVVGSSAAVVTPSDSPLNVPLDLNITLGPPLR